MPRLRSESCSRDLGTGSLSPLLPVELAPEGPTEARLPVLARRKIRTGGGLLFSKKNNKAGEGCNYLGGGGRC